MKNRTLLLSIHCLIVFMLVLPELVSAQNINRPNKTGPLGLEVNTLTGNLFFPRSDLSIVARSFNLDATFYYNSFNYQRDIGFGNGWSFLYSIRYRRDTGARKIITWGDGREEVYTASTNSFQSPKGVFNVLQEFDPGKLMLRKPGGVQLFFEDSTHKRITRITELNGNFISFHYTDTLLTSITNSDGQSLSFSYSEGRLKTITDATGTPARVFSYTYDEAGNLKTVSDPLNGTHNYTYLVNGPIKTAEDKNKNVANIIYYNDFSVRELIGCNKRVSFSYDTVSLTTYVVDHALNGENKVTKYVYKEHEDQLWLAAISGNCCGFNASFEFDAQGNKIKETDANGNVTKYAYDSRGNVLSITDALNQTISYTYEETSDRITSVKDLMGLVTTMSYDSKGNLVQLAEPGNRLYTATYNAKGDLTSSTNPKGQSFTYQYDAKGNLTGVTGPAGYQIAMSYDGRGNLLSYQNAKGHVATMEYDILDRLKKLTDPLQQQLQLSYDAEGNITAFKNQNNEINQYAYDASSRVVRHTDVMGNKFHLTYNEMDQITSLTNTIGSATRFTFDKLNRLSAVTDAMGNQTQFSRDASGNVVTVNLPTGQSINYNYDALHRISAISDATGPIAQYSYDKNGNVVSFTNGTGATVQVNYDNLNRVTKLTDAQGHFLTLGYDDANNITAITDQNGNTSHYTYDNLNRIETYTDNHGSVITVSYDAGGNVTSLADQKNNVTTYTYDALRRLIRTTYPGGSFTEYNYNAKSNVTSKRLTDGSVINYTYDSLDRIISKQLPDGQTFTYTYDAAGRLLTATNSTGTVALAYDALNRLVSETFDGSTVRYQYNLSGRTQTTVYPDSTVITKTYDGRNRLINIAKNNTVLVTYTYNNANQVLTKTYGNGIITRYQYDFANRLINLSSANGSIQNTLFTYDKAGNKISANRLNNPGLSEEFSYDNAHRLLTYERGLPGGPTVQNSYVYDAVGNRTAAGLNGLNTTYGVNPLNQLTSRANASGNVSFQYDANGNLVYDGSFYKTYDAEGRLVKDSASPSNLITYQYDGLGRRVIKTINGAPYKYVYSGLKQIEERDAISNSLLNRTIFHSFLSPAINEKNNQSFFYHQNELNSVEAVTNNAGQLAEQYVYDPYGKPGIFDGNGNTLAASVTGNRFGFTGQEYNKETGNYRFFFRDYSPELGIFNQRDPIEYEDQMGMYQYAGNNPANGIDILGLEPCPPGFVDNVTDKVAHGSNWIGILNYLRQIRRQEEMGLLKTEYSRFDKFNLAQQALNLELQINKYLKEAPYLTERENNIRVAELEASLMYLGGDVAGGTALGKTGVGKAATGALSTIGFVDGLSQEFTGKSLSRRYGELDEPSIKLANRWLRQAKERYEWDQKRLDAYSKLFGEDRTKWDREWQELYERHQKAAKTYKTTELGTYREGITNPDCPPNNNTGGVQRRIVDVLNTVVFKILEVISALDPNEIIGPDGYGNNKWVAAKDRLPYTITYENDKSATAPAKFVRITAPIQPKMDATTFELGSFGFNSLTFSIPNGTSSYYHRVDARDSLGLYIDVTAGYDQFNNRAFWEFQSIDPTTLLPPTDPLKGFLLLQDSVKKEYGHGFVNFSIKPVLSATTGDTISAVASIVFDQNAAIETNRHKNTIDAFAPTSSITGLPAMTPDTEVPLQLSGADDTNGSGIRSFAIYVSDNDGPVQLYVANFSGADTTFRGLAEHQYKFYVAATDNVGNTEELKLAGTVRISDGEEVICPNGNTTFESNITGTTYQWQVNNGAGFTNLSDGGVYSGSKTAALSLTNAPSNFYGYQYRCLVNGATFSNVFVIKFAMTWEGTVDNAWENVANWSCNTLPDMNTDVIVNGGKERYPQVSSNVFVRTLRTTNGASVTVKSGFNLTVVK